MVRLPKWLLVVLVIGALVGFVSPALAADSTGKIKSINNDKNEFVFTDKDGKDWTFHMDNKAKIRLGTEVGKLADLKVGDEVTVVYTKDGDKLTATEVRRK